jgi:hypothetical protein
MTAYGGGGISSRCVRNRKTGNLFHVVDSYTHPSMTVRVRSMREPTTAGRCWPMSTAAFCVAV